eukprot:gene21423-27751_t
MFPLSIYRYPDINEVHNGTFVGEIKPATYVYRVDTLSFCEEWQFEMYNNWRWAEVRGGTPLVYIPKIGYLDSIGTGLMSRSIANSQSVSISDLISRKTMITGVNVNIEEFDIYEYKGVYSTTSQSGNNNDNVDELIFCIKEFKAMLLFCESLNINDFRFWFINAGWLVS